MENIFIAWRPFYFNFICISFADADAFDREIEEQEIIFEDKEGNSSYSMQSQL